MRNFSEQCSSNTFLSTHKSLTFSYTDIIAFDSSRPPFPYILGGQCSPEPTANSRYATTSDPFVSCPMPIQLSCKSALYAISATSLLVWKLGRRATRTSDTAKLRKGTVYAPVFASVNAPDDLRDHKSPRVREVDAIRIFRADVWDEGFVSLLYRITEESGLRLRTLIGHRHGRVLEIRPKQDIANFVLTSRVEIASCTRWVLRREAGQHDFLPSSCTLKSHIEAMTENKASKWKGMALEMPRASMQCWHECVDRQEVEQKNGILERDETEVYKYRKNRETVWSESHWGSPYTSKVTAVSLAFTSILTCTLFLKEVFEIELA